LAKANNIPVVIDGSWKLDLKQYCLGLIMPFVPQFLSAQLQQRHGCLCIFHEPAFPIAITHGEEPIQYLCDGTTSA